MLKLKFDSKTVFILSFFTHLLINAQIQKRGTDLPGAGHDLRDFVNPVACSSSYLSPINENGDVIPYDRWRKCFEIYVVPITTLCSVTYHQQTCVNR